VERDGQPVEPHPYLLLKTFLEIGVEPTLALKAADGSAFDVARLLADLRASVQVPQTDAQWHDAPWWLTALELDAAHDPGQLPRLRTAAMARLEADDAVFERPTPTPFAASAPMGAAKRNKTLIYGHPCGGLHFVQAVLRGAADGGTSDLVARAGKQLRLLLVRYRAERALYADTLRTHPEASLLVSGQQLKFFGHLLETLALADRLGLLRHDPALAQSVHAAQPQLVADLLSVLGQLERDHAYARLDTLSAQQHQLFLDLIGDGCHALHGLRECLPMLTD